MVVVVRVPSVFTTSVRHCNILGDHATLDRLPLRYKFRILFVLGGLGEDRCCTCTASNQDEQHRYDWQYCAIACGRAIWSAVLMRKICLLFHTVAAAGAGLAGRTYWGSLGTPHWTNHQDQNRRCLLHPHSCTHPSDMSMGRMRYRLGMSLRSRCTRSTIRPCAQSTWAAPKNRCMRLWES